MKRTWIRSGLEELKFLKSPNDLKILCQKLAYFMPRVIGTLDKFTEVPPSLQIEPTNHCNLNCICCPALVSSREKGYMDFDLFRRIIDDASQIGVKRVHLYLHGEPMLHPQIVDMIRYVKSKAIGFHLTTNGTPFNRQKIEAILCSGVNSADHIIFSILGYSKKVHGKIMKGVDHDKVLKNIDDFLELRKKHGINGPVIETIFYAMPENEQEKDQFVKHWRRKVDHARTIGRISEQFSGFKRQECNVAPRKRTCTNLWERMVIFWNGDVTRCIADVDGNYLLGSLDGQSIKEVWNSEPLWSIKKIHKEKQFQKVPLCFRCDW